jgi:putative transposase
VPSDPPCTLPVVANVCLVAPVKLLPTAAHADALRATVERANAARSWIAERGHAEGCFGRTALHRLTYYEARERFGLSAQMAVRAIGSVVECFSRDRRVVARFRANAEFPYDGRVLRVRRDRGEISIWTLGGRQLIPFVCGERQRELLEQAEKLGECDLRPLADGRWMLDITVEVEAPEPDQPDGWLGVDLGVVNIATDSDGNRAAGGRLNGLRRRHRRVRGRLQAKRSRSARRRLMRRAGRERRFATDVNHRIAKELVRRAERTGRGIALEDLKGIRDRIRARRSQRGALHSWAFAQLKQLILYKAQLAGVAVEAGVHPRNTSRQCPRCGHTHKRNRRSQPRFRCVECGHRGHANHIAACNIAGRAAVNRPNVPRDDHVSAHRLKDKPTASAVGR